MKKKTAGLIAIVMIASVIFFGGCVEKNRVDVAQVREYADPITENILFGMNEENYTKYSDHFD